MTYKFNKEEHSLKVKTGIQKARQAGKTLGRPKGKDEESRKLVLLIWLHGSIDEFGQIYLSKRDGRFSKKRLTYAKVAEYAKVSTSTARNIIIEYLK